jgi:hypothetical protein
MADDVTVIFGAQISGLLAGVEEAKASIEGLRLLERAEIAAMLRQIQSDISKQEGKPDTARAMVAALMEQAFDLPVAGAQARARLRVVD